MQYIFDRIGLENTHFLSRLPKRARKFMMKGYFKGSQTKMPPSLAGSVGEIVSSLQDLKKFLIAWQNGSLLSESSLKIQRQKGSIRCMKVLTFYYTVMV